MKSRNLKIGLTTTITVILFLGLIVCSEQQEIFINVFAPTTEEIHKSLISKNVMDSEYLKGMVDIEGFNINVDIALTENQKQYGLSIRNNMQENEGMIFVFQEPKQQSFWMKGMKFPIDIIWLDSNLSVVHIEKNLEPCKSSMFCPSYRPASYALYVLETVSGFTDDHDVKIDDKINFKILE